MKIIIWIVAIIIAGCCVLTTIEASAFGSEVSDLISKEESLKETQLNLNRELITASSLGSINNAAQVLGFTRPEKTVYINKVPEFAAR